VTETEVQHGLLEPGTHTENSAIWLKREIDDIDKLENNYAVSRYKGTYYKTNCVFYIRMFNAGFGISYIKKYKIVIELNCYDRDITWNETDMCCFCVVECLGPERKVEKSQRMLRELKEQRMAKVLSPDNILNYHVNWQGGK